MTNAQRAKVMRLPPEYLRPSMGQRVGMLRFNKLTLVQCLRAGNGLRRGLLLLPLVLLSMGVQECGVEPWDVETRRLPLCSLGAACCVDGRGQARATEGDGEPCRCGVSCGSFCVLGQLNACRQEEYCHNRRVDSDDPLVDFAEAIEQDRNGWKFIGECRARPDGCSDDGLLVCGFDGQTYVSQCEAILAGTEVKHLGSCELCDGARPCPDGSFCFVGEADECGENAAGHCLSTGLCETVDWQSALGCDGTLYPGGCDTSVYDPVCGCDGERYLSRCEAELAGVGVANDGECL